MAIVDFVWQPDATVDIPTRPGVSPPAPGLGGPKGYVRVAEGTDLDRHVPLVFTLSAPQAEDVTIRFGLDGGVSFVYRYGPRVTFDSLVPDAPSVGLLAQGEDLEFTHPRGGFGLLEAVIPAGATAITYALRINADRQPETTEYFNLYIESVSGGHAIEAADLRANQHASVVLGEAWRNSFGFNTFGIVDDDAPGEPGLPTAGADVVTLAEGDRRAVFAGSGGDRVTGTSGSDVVLADDGADTVLGLGGDDALNAGAGTDLVLGGDGADVLFGRTGDDTLGGEAGNDVIQGGIHWDQLSGGPGDDQLDGGDGGAVEDFSPDIIRGGEGNDVIAGRQGGDLILGGPGSDVLSGGQGQDLFVFAAVAEQGDIIVDFSAGPLGTEAQDGIDLRGWFDAVGYAGVTPRLDGWMWTFQNRAATDIWLAQAAGDFASAYRAMTLWNVVEPGLTDGYFVCQ